MIGCYRVVRPLLWLLDPERAHRASIAALNTPGVRALVRARAAADNTASIALLTRLGYVEVGRDRGYANARGEEIEEIAFVLR